MKNEIQIIVGSPIDHEELVAYILVDGINIAMLNQDEGKDKIKIVFFEEAKSIDLHLDLFVATLKDAKKELMK